MTYQIPTVEPLHVRAGDTWRWRRALPDFPAPTWVLTYTLFSSAGVVTLTAAADGAEHLIDVAPAETSGTTAGRYDWVAHVSDGTDRHQVGAGSLTVLPDLSEAASYDGRSHARKVLEALDAAIEQRATEGDLDILSNTFGNSATTRDPAFLIQTRARYAAMVAAEDDRAAAARGARPGMVQVRF